LTQSQDDDLEEQLAWQAKISEEVWAAYSKAEGVKRVSPPGQHAYFEVSMPGEHDPLVIKEEVLRQPLVVL